MTEGFTQREIPCHCHAKAITAIPQKLSHCNYAGMSFHLNNILECFPKQPKSSGSSGSKPLGGRDLLPKALFFLTLVTQRATQDLLFPGTSCPIGVL